MSWTACFEDECWVHRSDKDGAYYPQGPRQQPVAVSSGWEAQVNSPEWGRKTPTGPKRQREPRGYQARKEGHARSGFRHCFRDGCQVHLEEKKRTWIWPRKPLPMSARTPTVGEGSEKRADEMGQLRLKTVELMQELQKEQMETARLRMELDRSNQHLREAMATNEQLRKEWRNGKRKPKTRGPNYSRSNRSFGRPPGIWPTWASSVVGPTLEEERSYCHKS